MSQLIALTNQSRVLVIAPHPDDESLGSGGLIQRTREAGGAVRVVFVTDGDNNPWPQRVMERRLIVGPSERAAWGQRRRAEAMAATQRLGLSPADAVFLGLPDQGLTSQLLSGDGHFRQRLRQEIDAFSPTVIASPAIHDHHADHSAIAVLVRLTLREPSPLGPNEVAAAPVLYEYLIHGPTPADRATARSVSLTHDHISAKREATLCHRTQVMLSRKRFLAYATEVEFFGDPADACSVHAVRELLRDGDGWRIDLRPRRWFDRLAASRLDLLACDGPTVLAYRQVIIATGWGNFRRPTIVDARTGQTIARGAYDAAGRLVLPGDAFPPASTIFAKREGGIAFFDEGGWKEFRV